MTKAEEIRVLLVSASPTALLRILDVPGISVCSIADSAAQSLPLLPALQPHAVLFADYVGNLPAVLQSIQQLLPLSPPRILCRMEEGCLCDAAFDHAMPHALPVLLRTACSDAMGVLALPSFDRRFGIAQSLLTRLGMPQLLGRESIALGAVYLSAMPQPVPPAQHWLYPLLAEKQHTSPAAIERRIRSVIESTWLHGDLQAQGELFGLTVSAERGKPTNAEFLSLLSEHIRLKLI
ncbi:MAG: sporulation initiation factor Spo0A C-terminal domain-containing protein [Clostridia bacterium]|nr:sporulation initiation factor Spo0A C-terminal domain-containing protein [Clostridia bacterium]